MTNVERLKQACAARSIRLEIDEAEVEATTPLGLAFDPGCHYRIEQHSDGCWHGERQSLAAACREVLDAVLRVTECDCARCEGE